MGTRVQAAAPAARGTSTRPERSRLIGLLRATAEGVARRLPPPRDEAFLNVARSVRALLAGSPPPGRRGVLRQSRPDTFADQMAWRHARREFERGEYEAAMEIVETIIETNPDSARALSLKRDIHARLGEVSEVVRTIHQLRAVRADAKLAAQERAWIGRMIETDPHWLPRIPGPADPVVPRSETAVMHLLKESLPYHQNGFTMRSRYTLLAQRTAGLDPFVVTSLGFPRKDGVEDFESCEVVDDIRHHRLDLGAGYPDAPPYDVLLTDYAWLAAKVARDERPAVIHASSGFRGFETALVGLALREHLQLPLVYEVRSFFETTWTGDAARSERNEHYQRRFDTESRCMQAADAVVTIGEAMADDIVARGVPRERVHVIPNGVDPSAFEPADPDPELRHRYGLDGKTVFGYVSTLDHPREGQEILIEATARLLRRGRQVVCLIVGDGARRDELEELARQTGVGDAVVFTGRVPHAQVRAHYALLDLFVVPRLDDRAARLVTPLKPFEAMAMAKPLVVSDLPALVEIAAPGERGLTFAAGDPDSLADAIDNLIARPVLAARLGRAAREWVVAERTWDRNGARYREIYDDVRARHAHAARTWSAIGAVPVGERAAT